MIARTTHAAPAAAPMNIATRADNISPPTSTGTPARNRHSGGPVTGTTSVAINEPLTAKDTSRRRKIVNTMAAVIGGDAAQMIATWSRSSGRGRITNARLTSSGEA